MRSPSAEARPSPTSEGTAAAWTRTDALPPGQRAASSFPRFGTHLYEAPPAVPDNPVIEISGAVREPFAVGLAEVARLPRRELRADLHCVAGWSATGLCWEGVRFRDFWREMVEPSIGAGAAVTHLVVGGLDGFWTVVALSDALGDDVLIADRLDSSPLDADHGAPARVVSPQQYGYVSVKHLCRIELHTTGPRGDFGHASTLSRISFHLPILRRHPHARVWEEERHPYLPAWSVLPVFRLLTPPIRWLSGWGARRSPRRPHTP